MGESTGLLGGGFWKDQGAFHDCQVSFMIPFFSPFLNNCGWNTIIGSNATNG